MKRTSKAFFSLLVTWLILLFLLSACNFVPDGGRAVHFTEVDLMQVPCAGAIAPSLADGQALAGTWVRNRLPYLPVKPDMQCLNQVIWLRMDLLSLRTMQQELAIYIPRVKLDGQLAIYGDGKLLTQSSTRGLAWGANRTPFWADLAPGPSAAIPREILIRMSYKPSAFDAISTIWLGPPDSLRWRHQSRQLLQVELPALCGAAFPLFGIFSLGIWLRRRASIRFLLYFFVALITFTRGILFFQGQLMANDTISWLKHNSMFCLLIATHLFIRDLHGQRQAGLTRVLLMSSLLVACLSFPAFEQYSLVRINIGSALFLVLGLAVALAGFWGSRGRSASGLLVASSLLISLVFALVDILLQQNLIDVEGLYLGFYTNLVSFLTFSYIMFKEYLRATDELAQSNETLAARLGQREAELKESFQRLLRIEEQETLNRERQRMMQDMHDGIGSSLRSALWTVERGRCDVAHVAEVLRDCIDDLKLAIDSMEPVQPDLLLLLAALRYRLGSRLENSGIALAWNIKDIPALSWLGPASALHVLRILQEAFTNVIKHAKASELSVSTDVHGNGVVIVIEDNGDGHLDATAHAGRGLRNQRERALAIGGDIAWVSSSGGTRLTLWLPQEPSASRAH